MYYIALQCRYKRHKASLPEIDVDNNTNLTDTLPATRCTKATRENLLDLSEQTGLPIAFHIRRAVEAYLISRPAAQDPIGATPPRQ